MRTPKATVDFETRSACSLKLCGAWRYSVDPTTEVLCLAYRLPYWETGRVALWHPAFPHLGMKEGGDTDDLIELFDWIAADGLLEAHNAFFERCIWRNILTPTHGFPSIHPYQWRCSAAKAAAHSLPRHLEAAGLALRLKCLKDTEGTKVMRKVSKPRKSLKKERLLWEKTGMVPPKLLWHESTTLFDTLFAYCRQDVRAEEALSSALDDLSPHETRMYLMDQTVNERGFQLDPAAVTTALSLITSETSILNRELSTITSGTIQRATQRAQLLKWLAKQGVHLENTQADTLDEILTNSSNTSEACSGPLPSSAHRAIEILRSLGRSSTAKYSAMQNWSDPSDHRARGGLLFHGATTGRWSGSGIQPHNFPKGSVKDMEALWTGLLTRDRTTIANTLRATTKETSGGVMEALSQALRGAIVASRGKQLYVADYASIEARVLLWLADDDEALDTFRHGGDIYCVMAEAIYGYACNKKDHPTERALGKIAVLGLGYQMGAPKFQATCAKFGIVIDEDLAQQTVDAYRGKFFRVKNLWWDQEAAAIQAVAEPDSYVTCGRVTWRVEGSFLYCVLPSGRRLAYPFPQLRQRETPWGEMKLSLTFMGVNPYNHQWQRQVTYGGMLVENIVQAISRDLMADAMLRLEAGTTYAVLLSVHDEILAEADLDAGDVHEFEQLMSRCPRWATGCPITAEGWRGMRYHK